MKTNSLVFRLRTAAALLIVLALTLAGFGLNAIFQREIERRAAEELTQTVRLLAAEVRLDPVSGAPLVNVAPRDPHFETPYGGRYWQVSRSNDQRLRSRSLWDFIINSPQTDGERLVATLSGPNGSLLLAVVQDISVPSDKGDVLLRIVSAADKNELAAAQRSFLSLLAASLAALGVILIIAMSVFIRLALRPIDELGRGLQAIHGGTSRALAGSFPDEVQPVVDDLNRLIHFQDAAVDRAKTHASDLAHGLKTPLAVLAALGRQSRREGRGDIGESIDEQVTQMQRQVDRVLARARAGIAAAVGRDSIAAAPVAQKVSNALMRLPDEKSLKWTIDLSPSARFPGDENDLTELLGNLLDNARKWARSEIKFLIRDVKDELVISVEDDGPGMSEQQASQISRGLRWDESQPGTGFGLAITRDLAEGYRGSFDLDRSPLGGLRAIVTVPLPTARS